MLNFSFPCSVQEEAYPSPAPIPFGHQGSPLVSNNSTMFPPSKYFPQIKPWLGSIFMLQLCCLNTENFKVAAVPYELPHDLRHINILLIVDWDLGVMTIIIIN